MKKEQSSWLEVDRKGLAQVIADKPPGFILLELLQNALDEDVTEVSIKLVSGTTRGQTWIIVEDDSPDGYQDIRHAWTLYAPSKKKGDAEKRGRFNIGCKHVLALAISAHVISTKAAVIFTPEKGRGSLRRRRERGTEFKGLFWLSKQAAHDAAEAVLRVLPPEGVTITITTIDGVEHQVCRSEPVQTLFKETLPTVRSDDEGILRMTARKTDVEIHEPEAGEPPTLYEMGIPVVELDGGLPYHINVMQRVPLNQDRDNVTPAYLRKLRVLVLNALHDRIGTEEAATATWVADASSSPDCEPAAFETVLTARYGEDRVAFDPSDPEANKIAVAAGKTVVHGGSLSRGQWDNARRDRKVLLPAGKVHPSPKVLSSPDGVPPVPRPEWNARMVEIAEWAQQLYPRLFAKKGLQVTWYDSSKLSFMGAWKVSSRLSLNKAALRLDLFEWGSGNRRPILRLLIHEFAHERESDHLSRNYYRELCRIGAELAFMDVE